MAPKSTAQEHLDDELIARALAGALAANEWSRAREHTAGCPTCRERLAPAQTGSVSGEATLSLGGLAARLPPGGPERVGRYLIVDTLGAGGMGAVYSAFDPELDRRIAVKVLHPPSEGSHPTLGQARLLREAQAMARLQHPNVIAVYDVGTVDDRVFFAMERVDGGTLRSWLGQRRGWREVVAIFMQAGRGLAAAHAAGIVHRDFKPENVLIGKDGRVRVTDFGVARAVDEAGGGAADAGPGGPPPMAATLTRVGQLVGTPGYMAPEQLDGQVTAKTDQFSFCVALYEALVGERPFARWPFETHARELRSKRVEFPAGAEVPGFVREVVLRGLEKDPGQRFPTMEALLEALARDPRARRTRMVVVAAIAAAVAIVGGRALVVRAQHQRACGELAGRVPGVWERNRGAITAAFRAAKNPHVAGIQRSVEGGFAAFARDWSEARRAVCLGEAPVPPEQLAQSGACLDHAADIMRHAAELLARGDSAVIQHAGQILAALPPLRSCVDVETLRSTPPPPRDPAKAAAVPAARTRLARARIQAIPRPQEGIADIKALLADIETLGSAPALAEAYFVLGDAQLKADLTGDAAPSLQRAAELALAGGDDRLFVRAASRLAYVVGGFHNETTRAADWMQLARKAFERTGSPPALAAWLSLQQVAVHIGAGQWPECVKTATEAVEGARREGDHFNEAEATYILSFCTDYAYGPEAARSVAERALELFLTWVGPDHPETAEALAGVADYRWSEGDHAGALALREQVLKIRRSVGRPTLALAMVLESNAELLAELGHGDQALSMRREALEVLRQVPHPPKADVRLLADLALSERAAGLVKEARAHAREANAACTEEVQRQFPEICAHAQFIDAQLLFDRGERALAARQAARARDGFATLKFDARQRRRRVERWAREAGLALPPARG